jgi:hypothetical protein
MAINRYHQVSAKEEYVPRKVRIAGAVADEDDEEAKRKKALLKAQRAAQGGGVIGGATTGLPI